MEETKNEKTEPVVQNTEEVKGEPVVEAEEVSLGKFKNVNALIHAYNALEAEFTKRCQRIKELEGATQSVDKAVAPKDCVAEEKIEEQVVISKSDKERILKEYLKNVLGLKQKAVLIENEGNGIKTPVKKPHSLQEAGVLAKEILK